MGKTAAIIQARMGSTRLPGKVLKMLKDRTVLGHVIKRVEQSKEIDEIIIATTTLKRDDDIVKEAKNYDVKYFRGSEENVLSRYYNTAREYNINTIVRITSDCPLIDPKIIDEIIRYYHDNNYDLVTNAGPDVEKRTYPRGMDTEVFSFNILKEVYNNVEKKYEKEHVTPHIYENYNNIYFYKNDKDYSDYRLTLDENKDWDLIKKIYDSLYNGEHNLYLDDIISLFYKRPELKEINKSVEQKKLKE